MEFKELVIDDLIRGYTESDNTGTCTCIFCGESFREGVVYSSRERQVTHKRAAEEHVYDVHGGVFYNLVNLDKQVNGLTKPQKDILKGMYEEQENRELAKSMGITTATVRTHKFNVQKMKREAKILLALLEHIENEELVRKRRAELSNKEEDKASPAASPDFTGNMLHPFFTKFNLR